MNNRARVVKDILWFFALSGLVAAIFRMIFGLGVTTNLTDGVPWGFWKVFNMIAGVALSTSGFTVGFLVYVLRLKQFKPFVKPAILIAFLGYGCSCLALLFDIGLPQRFWHPIFMWNINSFLFEVFWCVLLYFTVTAIELAPVIFEGIKAKKLAKFFHGIAFVAVIVGISLSSLHHSSLGSLFLVSPQRLFELWYSPRLPLFFIISAMGAGLMFVVFVRIIWARIYDPEPVFGAGSATGDTTTLTGANGLVCSISSRREPGPAMKETRRLASIGAGLLSVYFIIKIVDLFIRGDWTALTSGTPESWLYGIELGLGVLLPIVLVVVPWTRKRPVPLATAAFLAAFGLVMNRLNVGIFGYFRNAGEIYFPSLAEWAVGFGVIAAAGLVFMALTEYLPIFDERPFGLRTVSAFRHNFGSLRQTWNSVLSDSLHRVSLLAVFVIPVAFVFLYPPYKAADNISIEPPLALDQQRRVLNLDGDRSGLMTVFEHGEHQNRLGGDESCGRCHHVSVPDDRSTPCSRCHTNMFDSTKIFDHEEHLLLVAKDKQIGGWHPENKSCGECHVPGEPESRASAKDCMECHKQDMFLVGKPDSDEDLMYASSFCTAMHGTCLECHKKESEKNVDLAHIDECYSCHRSLKRKEEIKTLAGQDVPIKTR